MEKNDAKTLATLATITMFHDITTRLFGPHIEKKKLAIKSRDAGDSKGVNSGKPPVCCSSNRNLPVQSANGVSPAPLLYSNADASCAGHVSER